MRLATRAVIESQLDQSDESSAAPVRPDPSFSAVESGFFDAGELLGTDGVPADAVARAAPFDEPQGVLSLVWSDLRPMRRWLIGGAGALFLLGAGAGIWTAYPAQNVAPASDRLATAAPVTSAEQPARAAEVPAAGRTRAPRTGNPDRLAATGAAGVAAKRRLVVTSHLARETSGKRPSSSVQTQPARHHRSVRHRGGQGAVRATTPPAFSFSGR